jgi:hypothetical protein
MGRGFKKGRCYTYIIKMFGNKEVERTIFSKNVNINANVAYKTIINCIYVAELRRK